MVGLCKEVEWLNYNMRMRKNPKNDSFWRFFKSDLGSARTHISCGIAGGMGASRTIEDAEKFLIFPHPLFYFSLLAVNCSVLILFNIKAFESAIPPCI